MSTLTNAACAAARTIVVATAAAALAGCMSAAPQAQVTGPDTTPAKRMVTHGKAQKVIVENPTRCAYAHPYARKPSCEEKCYAVHYPIPANWQSAGFNDAGWPRAWEYTDVEIGVTNLPAYTRYPELFQGARWIWTQNLVLDNVVIARKTVR